MDKDSLKGLERLNQLALTPQEVDDTLAFFAARQAEWDALAYIDTTDVERMVHVAPMETVVREDVVSEPFDREQLLEGAPDAMDGYWQVPYVLE